MSSSQHPEPLSLRPDLPLSAVASIGERAAAAGWTDVIPMAGGEPRFAPPIGALAALAEADADSLTKYSPFKGTPSFLEGAQRKIRAINDHSVGLDELIAVPGGAQALFSALSVLIHGERRRVVVTDPCWEHYPRIAAAAGATEVVTVPTTRDGAHDTIDMDALAAACTPATAAVLLNTPLNPTGSVLSSEELCEVGRLCRSVGARLVVDEEYETFIYGGRAHVTARSACPDAISLFSLSKSFALTGIRLGYISAEPTIVDALKRFGLFTYMYSPSPSLVIGSAVLHQPDLIDYLSSVRSDYELRATSLAGALDALPGVTCAVPEGGVYVFPEIRGPSGDSLAAQLIDEAHLLCVPGEVAGATGRGHVRFFVGVDEGIGAEAVARVATTTRQQLTV